MAAINRRFLLQSNLFALLVLIRLRLQQKRRKHRFWVRRIFQLRERYGAYHTLVQEMRLFDREYFFR